MKFFFFTIFPKVSFHFYPKNSYEIHSLMGLLFASFSPEWENITSVFSYFDAIAQQFERKLEKNPGNIFLGRGI